MMAPSTGWLPLVRPSPKPVRWLAFLALVAMMGSGCKDTQKTADGTPKTDTEASIPVEVEPVRRGPIESTLRTFATLEAEQEVKVYARTANRVVELKVEEGDHVRKDDILVRLDDANQKVAVAKAANSLDKSRQEFGRLDALHSQRLISDQAFADAKFEVRQLELAVEDAQRELDYTVIRAPITGTLTRRIVKLGDLVSANQHLFDLIDFTSTVARVYVPEKSLANLALGQAARVTATAVGEHAFTARVRRIAPVVDAKSGTVKVTIGFDEIGPLRPGMYVDVELILNTRADALLISKRALVLDGDQTFAFRLGADRRVERLLVEPRATDRLNVEPISGFKEGDQVVIAGQTGLKNGAKVRLPGDPDPEAEKKKDPASAPALSASRE
jgi:membrane fusion protein (multidrug efflux system)